jgi:hypothetical protein
LLDDEIEKKTQLKNDKKINWVNSSQPVKLVIYVMISEQPIEKQIKKIWSLIKKYSVKKTKK